MTMQGQRKRVVRGRGLSLGVFARVCVFTRSFAGMKQPGTRVLANVFILGLLPALAVLGAGARAGALAADAQPTVEVSGAVHMDVSPPLRDIPSAPPAAGRRVHPVGPLPLPVTPAGPEQPDPVLQLTDAGPLVGTTDLLNFAGVGEGDHGFNVTSAPPDTNLAVGDTQVVQWVNTSFAVFNKATGAIVAGFPKAGNTVWSGFGGGCQTNNDGDPIAQYDKAANRWILTQFSVNSLPYLQCIAVSTTSDATGSYNRYAFSYGNVQFPDYPKLGVWPDAYYISFNIFNFGQTFAGAKACAYDRASMLIGAAATQQCFQLSPAFGGLLPSDLDGNIAPPAGSPNYFVAFGANSLDVWKFHVDWVTPGNSTFTGPTNVPVAPFTPACGGGGCIPQPGTTQTLDTLADRLMYRLAYRHFGDGHEALVVNHSVRARFLFFFTYTGIRWYELRVTGGSLTVFQQGTYAPVFPPLFGHRWMGSIAMDKVGNIAVGYSISSKQLFPSIRYTGRVPTDPPGTLQKEKTIKAGSGSQLPSLGRWGDYSAMSVDPVDDCTFFYTTEYLKASGTFNWSTRIASFKFPSCQ